mmetsp:Transcript_1318/g.1718  ORF Transcript_1318/g.1718 Transcript_1318/m.1718 type:complete len:280 (+) Transcript_1318:217-1056(+)
MVMPAPHIVLTTFLQRNTSVDVKLVIQLSFLTQVKLRNLFLLIGAQKLVSWKLLRPVHQRQFQRQLQHLHPLILPMYVILTRTAREITKSAWMAFAFVKTVILVSTDCWVLVMTRMNAKRGILPTNVIDGQLVQTMMVDTAANVMMGMLTLIQLKHLELTAKTLMSVPRSSMTVLTTNYVWTVSPLKNGNVLIQPPHQRPHQRASLELLRRVQHLLLLKWLTYLQLTTYIAPLYLRLLILHCPKCVGMRSWLRLLRHTLKDVCLNITLLGSANKPHILQ